MLLSLSLGSRVASRDGEPFGGGIVDGLCTLLVARLILRPLVFDDAVVGMRHDVLSPVLTSRSVTRWDNECSCVGEDPQR